MPIQVKAINGPSWQFNASSFLEIQIEDDVQTVLGVRKDINRAILCVFVLLHSPGTDEFFTLTVEDLQGLLKAAYKGGRRPKNPKSTHCALWPKHLEKFRGWHALESAVGHASSSPNPSRKRSANGK